jgi:hypothetical protein
MRQPAMLRPVRLIDMLSGHVYMLAGAETSTEREAGSVDHLGNAPEDWMLGDLADRLALALIGALA